MTPDTIRVVEWFRQHPDSTVNEAREALWLHVTARMSDAKKEGVRFSKTEQRVNGRRVVRFRVEVREPRPEPLRGEQIGWSL
jgi:hypothetical protein